jgi:hypothetical protein
MSKVSRARAMARAAEASAAGWSISVMGAFYRAVINLPDIPG